MYGPGHLSVRSDDNQAARLQSAQTVADITLIVSQRLDELIMAQDGAALGASILRHQTLENVALQPGQASRRHDESF